MCFSAPKIPPPPKPPPPPPAAPESFDDKTQKKKRVGRTGLKVSAEAPGVGTSTPGSGY